MTRFLHVGFNFGDRAPPVTELAEVLNGAKDWVRYAPNCWIVFTNLQALDWYTRLKPLLKLGDDILILELDRHLQRHGWLNQNVADWLSKQHDADAEGE